MNVYASDNEMWQTFGPGRDLASTAEPLSFNFDDDPIPSFGNDRDGGFSRDRSGRSEGSGRPATARGRRGNAGGSSRQSSNFSFQNDDGGDGGFPAGGGFAADSEPSRAGDDDWFSGGADDFALEWDAPATSPAGASGGGGDWLDDGMAFQDFGSFEPPPGRGRGRGGRSSRGGGRGRGRGRSSAGGM